MLFSLTYLTDRQRTDRQMYQGHNRSAELVVEASPLIVAPRKELADVIERIYQDHCRDLYVYLLLSGSSPTDAEEFLQEAFLRLLGSFQQGKQIENPKHWLLRVLHNIRFDERRRSSRFVTLDVNGLDGSLGRSAHLGCGPETAILHNERVEQLRAAMGQLTDRQYQCLLLRAEGLKLREIAQMFGVSTASVAESCGRAMDKLGKLQHE